MGNVINNVVLILICLACAGLVKLLIDEVHKFVDEKVKSDKARGAIDKALELVTLAVNTTNQTFVKDLKDKGSFGLDEAEEAFNASKKAVVDMLDEETRKILDEEFANVDKFLNQAIESKVWESKK